MRAAVSFNKSTLRLLLSVSFALRQSTLAKLGDAEPLYLEPNVQRHVGVIPVCVCQQLIDLGEEAGFLVREESIDRPEQSDPNQKFVPSQSISVYTRTFRHGSRIISTKINDEAIWAVVKPWVPAIAQIVRSNRDKEAFHEYYPNDPDREPQLDWIFFRKYSPDAERNSLTAHHDTNMNTVNIELSNDYEGGGLFYIKPSASTGSINEEYGGYEWTDSIKRENTSDIVFPDLHAGDAIFYNFTVKHAIAPIESGTRYSMAFFFDMDNPAVQKDNEYYRIFDAELHNTLSDVEVDIMVIYDAEDNEEGDDILFHKVAPNGTIPYAAYEGDVLRALVSGTDTVVADITMKRGQSLYKISEMKPEKETGSSDFRVKIKNVLPDMELDIVLVYDGEKGKEVREKVFDSVVPDESVIYDAIEGDVLKALVSGTDTAVADIEMQRDRSFYEIPQMEYVGSEL